MEFFSYHRFWFDSIFGIRESLLKKTNISIYIYLFIFGIKVTQLDSTPPQQMICPLSALVWLGNGQICIALVHYSVIIKKGESPINWQLIAPQGFKLCIQQLQIFTSSAKAQLKLTIIITLN
jgi:hypothetical protein